MCIIVVTLTVIVAFVLFSALVRMCLQSSVNYVPNSQEKEDQVKFVNDSSYTYKSYSYLSLEPIMKELDKRLDSIPDRIGFCCSCIMESEHYILIGLTDTTARNIQDFKDNVMDSPVFRFVQSEPACFDVEVIEIK